MYTVKVHCRSKGITRYLTFDDFTVASNCICAIKGVLTGRYSTEEFFATAKITRAPVGELLNEIGLETEYAYWFAHRTERN